MTKQVQEIVFNEDVWDIPEKVDDFLSYWREKIELVPAEYRARARVELYADSYYDSASLKLNISYLRDETEHEKLKAKAMAETEADLVVQRDHKQLMELADKYGLRFKKKEEQS